jgi:hypothetical protein
MQIVNEVGYTNEYLTPPSFVPGLEVLHIFILSANSPVYVTTPGTQMKLGIITSFFFKTQHHIRQV